MSAFNGLGHPRCDYLVIETSGVSDPETIIRALDKTFGKLTRARYCCMHLVHPFVLLSQVVISDRNGEGCMQNSKSFPEEARGMICLNSRFSIAAGTTI